MTTSESPALTVTRNGDTTASYVASAWLVTDNDAARFARPVDGRTYRVAAVIPATDDREAVVHAVPQTKGGHDHMHYRSAWFALDRFPVAEFAAKLRAAIETASAPQPVADEPVAETPAEKVDRLVESLRLAREFGDHEDDLAGLRDELADARRELAAPDAPVEALREEFENLVERTAALIKARATLDTAGERSLVATIDVRLGGIRDRFDEIDRAFRELVPAGTAWLVEYRIGESLHYTTEVRTAPRHHLDRVTAGAYAVNQCRIMPTATILSVRRLG